MNNLSQYAAPGEQLVAKKLVKAAITDGYTVSVSDGEEWTVRKSRNFDEIIDAMATTGIDNIRLRREDGTVVSTIALIYGNDHDGSELVADYTTNDEIERFMVKHRLAGN